MSLFQKSVFSILFLACISMISCKGKTKHSDTYANEDRSTNVSGNEEENNSKESKDLEVQESNDEFNPNNDIYPDGQYCAEITYYNPNTGTKREYQLNVEVEDGELVTIHWPNGGWLDESHFVAEDISSGECSFRSDKGYKYTVTLEDEGGCAYTDERKMKREVNEDVESITCPKCGDEKDSYDDLCDNCLEQVDKSEEEN